MRYYLKLTILSMLTVIIYVAATTYYIALNSFLSSGLDALDIVFIQVCIALESLWQFLLINKFCPWLMIFNGRPSNVIIFETSISASHLWHNPSFENLSIFLSGFLELVGGPTIGIVFGLFTAYISYMLYDLIVSKFFNK